MSPEESAWVSRVSTSVHQVGGAWFFADCVQEVGQTAGITDRFALYAGGRGGVTGDCLGDVVASCFAFFPPQIVKAKYRAALEHGHDRVYHPLREVHQLRPIGMIGQCLLGPHGKGMCVGLSTLRGPKMGQPLFAGWRALELPDDPAAAAGQLLMVLRELRGDLHIQAVVTSQMSPLEAIIGREGPERAEELFYPKPYPNEEEIRERRAAVEDLTNRLVAPAYLQLRSSERDQFAGLLDRAENCLAEP